MNRYGARAVAALLILVAGVAGVRWLAQPPAPRSSPLPAVVSSAAQIERGAYLARIGDCAACHTERGGAAYAGGRAIPTPFGTFYSPNITPHADSGLGRWSNDDFWQAMHQGRSRDGSPLYPVFPYTNYTRVTRADSDAIFAYLQSLPAVASPRREHALKFPYGFRPLLAGWRLLFFTPGEFQPQPQNTAEWNRGAYLVEGLGHCSACHESRNALGAMRNSEHPAGGLVLNWYAPSLLSGAEAGVSQWPQEDIVALLHTGVSPQASTLGPMAEVVYESLQHLTPEDVNAMAVYLQALPDRAPAPSRQRNPLRKPGVVQQRGAQVYGEHCASCHGDDGEGRPPAAPALAGNRALTMQSTVNPARIVLFGGYAPGTAGNPQPYGMPPFVQTLSDEDIAAVLSYTRAAWGNDAGPVTAAEVRRYRAGPLW